MSLLKILHESSKGLEFKKFFSQMTDEHGEFQDHISKSIPSYSEQTYLTAQVLADIYGHTDVLILDIGSSEGYFGDAVVSKSSRVVVHSLDPNYSMEQVYKKKRKKDPKNDSLKRNKFLRVAFGDGFYDEEEQRQYKSYKPKNKYDVVRESMTFQFISTNRREQYGLCKQALKPNGLFITNSKIKLPDQKEYHKYEKLKDEYKRKSFTDEEIEKKAKEILPNMSRYMVDVIETFEALQENFKYVVQYWVSGNFHGFACSDNEQTVNKFLSKMPERDGFPNSVEGKVVDAEVILTMKAKRDAVNR